jgi:hypothetical protein
VAGAVRIAIGVACAGDSAVEACGHGRRAWRHVMAGAVRIAVGIARADDSTVEARGHRRRAWRHIVAGSIRIAVRIARAPKLHTGRYVGTGRYENHVA